MVEASNDWHGELSDIRLEKQYDRHRAATRADRRQHSAIFHRHGFKDHWRLSSCQDGSASAYRDLSARLVDAIVSRWRADRGDLHSGCAGCPDRRLVESSDLWIEHERRAR